MSVSTWTRSILLAAVVTTGWLVLAAAHAQAMVDPDPGGGAALPPAAVEGPSVLQLVLVAALACLVAVAATLAVQAIVRRAHAAHGMAQV